MKVLFPILLFIFQAYAQPPGETGILPAEPTPVVDVVETVVSPLEGDLTSLSAILDSIRIREQKKADRFSKLQSTVDPSQKERLLDDINVINTELDSLRRQFQGIAIQADTTLFDGEPEKEFDLQSELEKLLQPLLAELKKATKDSRELEQLNRQLEINSARLELAEKALKDLEPLLKEATQPLLKEELTEMQALWTQRQRDARNQITVVERQLDQREQEKQSLLEQTQGMASGFVRTRGLNLLWGVLSFAGVFFVMRTVQKLFERFRPSKKKGKSFSSRLATLLWTLLTIVAAVGAMLSAFNATGDWFLLSLTLIFLIGIGWAAIKTLPAFIEQFRMMLNMGSVREDERLIYEGLPWKVNAISFRTELVNPMLDGGTLVVPTPMLVGQLSRPPGQAEEWFPSRAQDWILLSDGTFGRIAYQTPSAVQITSLGGSQRVIPTTRYLELSPTVLSTGFRKEIVFRIDYGHQTDGLQEIPGKMKEHLSESLTEKLGDDLKSLSVHFSEAAESSLNFTVWVDCKGDAAPHWPTIPMWTQQALVELCTRENWGIPFPQLQVHTES